MKKSHTRKRLALRRLALALLILTLANVTGTVHSLPRQAMEELIQRFNLTDTRVLKEFYNDAMPRRYARQYLVTGQEGIMLCSVGFDAVYGWQHTRGCAVPFDSGETLTLVYSCQAQGMAYSAQVFGRVEDERIARIVLRWRPGTGSENDFRYWEMPQDAFFYEDGQRYVFCDAPEVGMSDELLASEDRYKWNGFCIDDLTALAYDEAGRRIATKGGIPDYITWRS